MPSQITSLTIVNSTVYSMRRSQKSSKLRVTGLCVGNSPVAGEFPAQRASNVEKSFHLMTSLWIRNVLITNSVILNVIVLRWCGSMIGHTSAPGSGKWQIYCCFLCYLELYLRLIMPLIVYSFRKTPSLKQCQCETRCWWFWHIGDASITVLYIASDKNGYGCITDVYLIYIANLNWVHATHSCVRFLSFGVRRWSFIRIFYTN